MARERREKTGGGELSALLRYRDPSRVRGNARSLPRWKRRAAAEAYKVRCSEVPRVQVDVEIIVQATRSRNKKADSTCPAKCHSRSGDGYIYIYISQRFPIASMRRESRGNEGGGVSDRNIVISRTAATPDRLGGLQLETAGRHSRPFSRRGKIRRRVPALSRTFVRLLDGERESRACHRRKYATRRIALVINVALEWKRSRVCTLMRVTPLVRSRSPSLCIIDFRYFTPTARCSSTFD